MSQYDYPDRTFQMWEFHVSHGSLLIRSPRGVGHVSNLDLMFFGVEYLDVPRFLRGLRVENATPQELKSFQQKIGKQISPSSAFILTSSGQRFVVLAAGMRFDENEMDIFESPFRESR